MSHTYCTPTTSKRHQPSQEEWLQLRPIVRELYVERNCGLQAVIASLGEKQGFVLTRRQLTRKLKEWNFRKNTSKADRESLLHNHQQPPSESSGIRLTTSKLQRWQRNLSKEAVGTSARNKLMSPSEKLHDDSGLPANPSGLEIQIATKNEEDMSLDSDIGEDAAMFLEGHSSLSALLAAMSLEPLNDVVSFLNQVTLLRSRGSVRSQYISSDQYHQLSGSGSGSSLVPLLLNIYPDRPGFNVGAIPSKPASPFNEIYFFSSFESSQPIRQCKKNEASLTYIKALQNTADGLQERFAKLRSLLPDTHPTLITIFRALAKLYWEACQFKLSEIWARRVIEGNKQRGDLDSPQHLLDQLRLIQAICEQGRVQEAAALHQELLPDINRNKLFVSSNTAEHLAAESLSIQVVIAYDKGLFHDSSNFSKQEVQFRLIILGPYHEDTHRAMAMLALIMICLCDYTEALRVICLVLQLQEKSNQSSHRSRCWSMELLAKALRLQSRFKDSIAVAQCSEELSRDLLGNEHHATLMNKIEYGRCLRSAGLLIESEHAFRDALAGFTSLFGEDHVEALMAMLELGGILVELDRYEEASLQYEKALTGLDTEATQWALLDCCRSLGNCYEMQGRYNDAIALYEKTILRMKISSRLTSLFFHFPCRLGYCYLEEGRCIDAIRICKAALKEMGSLELANNKWDYQHQQFFYLSYILAESYLDEQQYYEASCVCQDTLQTTTQSSENKWYYDLLYVLAESKLGQQQYSEALQTCRSAMQDLCDGQGHQEHTSDWKRRFSGITADCYREQQRYEEASTLLEHIVFQIHGSYLWTYKRCAFYTPRLVECYKQLGRNADAVALYRRSVQEIRGFGKEDCHSIIAQLEESIGFLDNPSELGN